MVRPCRSEKDSGGNPTYKMHACAEGDSRKTLCGLDNPIDIDVVAGYRFLCRTCFPPQRETAWTSDNENTGDTISGDGRGEQPDESPAS